MKSTARYQEWLAGVKDLLGNPETKKKQIDIAQSAGVTPIHLNGILKGRRKAAEITQDMISAALGSDYDSMREKGREVLGMPPLGVLVSATQTGGVANVTMQGIFQTAEPAAQYGDIARDLCNMIAERLEGMDIDAQIALRARVKAALDEPEVEK